MDKCLDLVVGGKPTRLTGISFSLELLKLGNDGILYVLEDVITNNSFIEKQLDEIVNLAQDLKLGLFSLGEALTNPSSVPGNLSYKKLGLFVNTMYTTTEYNKSLRQVILLLHSSGVDLNQANIITVDKIYYPGIYTDYHGFKIILDSDSINNPEIVLQSLLFAYHTHQLSIKNPTVMGILEGFIKETNNTELARLTARHPLETDKTYYNRILSILFSNDVKLANVETMELINGFIEELNGTASKEIEKLTNEKFSFTGEIRYSTNKKLNDLASGYYNLFLKYESRDNTLISTVDVDLFVNKLSEYVGIANYTNNEIRNVVLEIKKKDPKLLGLLYDNINLFNIDTFHQLLGETTGDLYELLKERVGVSGEIGKVPKAINTLTNRVVNEVVTILDIGTLVFKFVTEKDNTNSKYFEITFGNLKDLAYKFEDKGKRIVINSRLEDKAAYDRINDIIQQGSNNVKIHLPAYLSDKFIKDVISKLDVTNKSVSVTNVTSKMVPKMYNLASALYVDELTVFTNKTVEDEIKKTNYSYVKRIDKNNNLYTSRYYLPLGTIDEEGSLVNGIVKLNNLNSSLTEASENALEEGTMLRDVEGLEGLLIVVQNNKNINIKVFNLNDGKFHDLTENQVSTIKAEFEGVEELKKLKNISEFNTFKFVLTPYSTIEFKFDGNEWKTDGMVNEEDPYTYSVVTEFAMSDGAKRNLLDQNRYYIENVNDSLYLVKTGKESSYTSNSGVTPELDPAYRFNKIKELFANAGITDFPRYTIDELNSTEYDSDIYNLSKGVYITYDKLFIVPEALKNLVEDSVEYENALRNIESRLYTTWAMKVDTDTVNERVDGTTQKEKFEQFNTLVLTDKVEKKREGLETLFGNEQSIEKFMLLDNYENYSTINPFGNNFLIKVWEANVAKHLKLAELYLLC